jgi:hypothetical protein
VLTDLEAYRNDPHHTLVRDTVINPLVQDGGFLAVDYEFPRGIFQEQLIFCFSCIDCVLCFDR